MLGTTKLCLLSLGLALPAFAREAYTRAFDQMVPLPAGGRVYLEHKLGDVVIRTHAEGGVLIHAQIKASAIHRDRAKQLADRIEILVVPSASQVTVRTRYPQSSEGSLFWSRSDSYTVRYELVIPESASLHVRNSFGGVSVTGVKASSDVITSHGDLEWRNGGGTQHLENSFAGVRVENNKGDVSVEAGNGGVEVRDVVGSLTVHDRFAGVTATRISKGVSVVNSNGSVDVTDSAGAAEIKNSFGDVNVHSHRGDLVVNNSNGRVEALHVEGAAELNTTFGQVHFEDIGGRLSVRSNSANVDGAHVDGVLTINDSFGSVKVSDVKSGVTIQSGNGAIWVSRVRGAANLKTSYAAVEARDVDGFLHVENNNGAVTATNVRGAQVATSFASVVLNGVAGPLRVMNQNGAVDAAGSPLEGSCQPISIRTSFSTLRVRLGGAANYRVAARTSFGQIHSDFPISVSGASSNDNLEGSIGTGHCEMTLNDNNGAIEIVKGGA